MEYRLDELDKAILEILQENSKLGIKEVALQIGLTITPTYERIKRLERNGIIQGYGVRLDKSKIGKGLSVFCMVSLKEHNLELLEIFEKKIASLSEVTTCCHIAGDYDYIMLIEVADMNEYETFLKYKLASIPSISNVQSSFVMSQVKA